MVTSREQCHCARGADDPAAMVIPIDKFRHSTHTKSHKPVRAMSVTRISTIHISHDPLAHNVKYITSLCCSLLSI